MNGILTELRAAIVEFRSVHADIAAQGGAEGWRRDLIAHRRRLQAQIGTISGLLQHERIDDTVARPLRDALNRLRTRLALHQADWPAVSIDQDDPDYRSSVAEVRIANHDFVSLAERLLATHSN